ncbi:MAG: Carbonic anhydrase precursor [Methanosaeta sp. PtaU1.Bin060]|nr:MAG: Carbonic anhydrase precursor [Methanosaeta sp. PtaU1.Bin060]
MLKANPRTTWNSREQMPTVSATAFVDESATLIGDVRVGEDVYIAPAVSIRADEASPIIIGKGCNIQDGVIFHGLKGSSITLGSRISIAHGAVVHGPMSIGDESFVGFNSVVHASALGERCFVGHGAVVIGVRLAEGRFVPHGALVDTQEKADALGDVPGSLSGFNDEVVEVNEEFAEGYSAQKRCCLGV